MSIAYLLTFLPLALDPVPEPEDVRPGWIAFIVVFSLIGVSVLLWFSMRKQIRKIQVPKDESRQEPPSPT